MLGAIQDAEGGRIREVVGEEGQNWAVPNYCWHICSKENFYVSANSKLLINYFVNHFKALFIVYQEYSAHLQVGLIRCEQGKNQNI